MSPVGPSSSSASQIYNGVQRNDGSDTNRSASVSAQSNRAPSGGSSFQIPANATPRGDWVLSENANPQNFEANAPRGSYLNVVV